MIKWFKKKKSKSQVDLDNNVEPFENPEEAMASPESEYVETPECPGICSRAARGITPPGRAF